MCAGMLAVLAHFSSYDYNLIIFFPLFSNGVEILGINNEKDWGNESIVRLMFNECQPVHQYDVEF